MTVIMDYPEAWAFARGSLMSDHDPRCSYRQTRGGILCDCHVIDDEYERRKAALA